MDLICTKDYFDSIFQFAKGESTVGQAKYSEFYKKQLLADNPDKFKVVEGSEKEVVIEEEEPVVITSKNFVKKAAKA